MPNLTSLVLLRNLYRCRASEGLQALCLGLPHDWAKYMEDLEF